jgi:hypothetical protein
MQFSLAHPARPEVPHSTELPNVRLLAELGPQTYVRRCLESARHYLQDPGPVVSSHRRQRLLHRPSDRAL